MSKTDNYRRKVVAALLPHDEPIAAFLERIENPVRQAEARVLVPLFSQVTGFAPRIWAGSMVGFGRYSYTYASGHSGESLATGFAPRAAEMVIYVIPGYEAAGPLLARLGPHRLGKACLYIKRLDRVDLDVLRQIIRDGLEDLGKRWTILPE
jgi:hypothetical protein